MSRFRRTLKRLLNQKPVKHRMVSGLVRSFRQPRIERLETRQLLAAVLVKDINVGAAGSNPTGFVEAGGVVYFRANDGATGTELWKTDGTPAGTTLVKDIRAGGGSSIPFNLTNANGTLFFQASDETSGNELWKSDGTANGTIRVKDINDGGASDPRFLTNVNGTLFFQANDGLNGQELWKSDGTAAGTVMVKDSRSGIASASPQHLTNVNGALFFRANDGTTGVELWRSDGTEAGTTLIKDIEPGGISSNPNNLTNVNGTLFFTAFSAANGGAELWKSDGTTNGTVLVKDIRPGGSSSNIASLINVNGTLYFSANDGTTGSELWKSDGTNAGTVRVKDINPGVTGSSPLRLTNLNGALIFFADDGSTGNELWKSDGTEAGTVRIKDINAGLATSQTNFFIQFGNFATGTYYFLANDGVHGESLWQTDGTESGTIMVPTVFGDGLVPNATYLSSHDGNLFFSSSDPTTGAELWFASNKFSGSQVGLSSSSVLEDLSPGGTVATISTIASDDSDTFIYSLVNGDGDGDNAKFVIEGNILKSAVAFDFAAQQTLSLRIRSTNSLGMFVEKKFVVLVEEVVGTPDVFLRYKTQHRC